MNASHLLRLGGLACFIAVLALSASPLLADNGNRPYSDGSVTGDDFKGDPPPPDQRPTGVGGVPIVAMIATAIEGSFKSSWEATTEGGKIVVRTRATEVAIRAFVNRTDSWIDPEYKDDKVLLEHEQGHPDNAELAARKAQAEANRKRRDGAYDQRSELPPDATPEQVKAETERQEQAIKDLVREDAAAAGKAKDALDKAYDERTQHGTDPKAQKKYRKWLDRQLGAPNTDPKRKKGQNAKSRSANSVAFDAASGLLTIDGDVITGIADGATGDPANPTDPVIGAELVFPSYRLAGETFDGLFFFSLIDPAEFLALTKGGDALMTLSLDYMVFDPAINTLYGLGGAYSITGTGVFLDQLDSILGAGGALGGVEIVPDDDFAALTGDFTRDGRSAITNGFGARSVAPVPLPPAGMLLAIVIGAVALGTRRAGARSSRRA